MPTWGRYRHETGCQRSAREQKVSHLPPTRQEKQLVIYTAVTGQYDTLRPPMLQPQLKAKFVAFVERPGAIRNRFHPFELRPVHKQFSDPNRNAKIHKVLSHQYFPRFAHSLWIDGNIELDALLPDTFIDACLADADVGVFHHTRRRCAYSEAATCIEGKLDDPNLIMEQVLRYTREGYKAGQGLASGAIILRRHTSAVELFNQLWWNEIQAGSRRDQISLNYAAQRARVRLAYLPNHFRRYFTRRRHADAHARIWTNY